MAGNASSRFFEDLLAARLTPARLRSVEVALTIADDEYSFDLPDGTREVLFSLVDSAVAWRMSQRAGDVAAGGTTIAAGGAYALDKGPYVGTVYFASSTAAQVMRVDYVAP